MGFALVLVIIILVVLLFRQSHRQKELGPLILEGMEEMATKIRAAIKLPPPGASDVVSRELLVQFNDRDEVSVNGIRVSPGIVKLGATDEGVLVTAKQNVEVRLSLVDVDAAGNRSQPSPELVVLFADTFAPPRPAALVIDGEEEFEENVTAPPTPVAPPATGDSGPLNPPVAPPVTTPVTPPVGTPISTPGGGEGEEGEEGDEGGAHQ